MSPKENDKPDVRVRSGLTISLITRAELMRKGDKVPLVVGHPQLRIHFTNQTLGAAKLFRDRNVRDEKAVKYPLTDIHLLIRVGEGSKKFEQFLAQAIAEDDALVTARANLEAIREERGAILAACNEHFSKVPGYSRSKEEFDAAERMIESLEDRRDKRGFLTKEQRELLRLKRAEHKRLEDKLAELHVSNPAPVDQRRFEELKRSEREKRSEIAAIESELRREKYAKKALRKYLADEKINNLPEKIFELIAKGEIDLYALEPSDPPCGTDRRGIPLAAASKFLPDGSLETDHIPCDREISIPWDYVLTGMEPANVNQTYVPGGKGRRKHFVYAPIDRSKPIHDDHFVNVDAIMVGQLPIHTKDEDEPGWAVILRKKLWVEVTRNIDIFRQSGLLEQFLNYCPDPSPRKSADTAKPAEDDEPVPAEPAATQSATAN